MSHSSKVAPRGRLRWMGPTEMRLIVELVRLPLPIAVDQLVVDDAPAAVDMAEEVPVDKKGTLIK